MMVVLTAVGTIIAASLASETAVRPFAFAESQTYPHLARWVKGELAPRYRRHTLDITLAIVNESKRHQFDPALLLAMIKNESRFNLKAIGQHGEIGLMQIRPETARWVAEKCGAGWRGEEALFDPAYNLRLGVEYLAMLRTTFGPKQSLFLAAYNMGPSQLRKLLGAHTHPRAYAQRTEVHFARIHDELQSAHYAHAGALL